MNLKAYANHRKEKGLSGQTHVSVIHAINDGRLSHPAVRKEGRNWVIDPVLADAQWAENTDGSERGAMGRGGTRTTSTAPLEGRPPAAGRAVGGAPPLAVSKAIRSAYDAKMAELEFKERDKQLGSIAEMKREAFALAKTVRDGMLGIIPRVSADLAALTDPFEIERRLEEEVLVALRVLSDG